MKKLSDAELDRAIQQSEHMLSDAVRFRETLFYKLQDGMKEENNIREQLTEFKREKIHRSEANKKK